LSLSRWQKEQSLFLFVFFLLFFFLAGSISMRRNYKVALERSHQTRLESGSINKM